MENLNEMYKYIIFIKINCTKYKGGWIKNPWKNFNKIFRGVMIQGWNNSIKKGIIFDL